MIWRGSAIALTSFFASLVAPVAVLIAGPIFFGFPHLFNSVFFVDKTRQTVVKSTSLLTPLFVFFGILSTVRLAAFFWPTPWIPKTPVFLIEGVACVATLFVLHWQQNFKELRMGFISILLLSPLLVTLYIYPLQTAGTLILLHNFIGFIFWMAQARTSDEKRACMLMFSATLSLSFILLFGILDPAFQFFPYLWSLGNETINMVSLGNFILPWFHKVGAENAATRVVIVYALGQLVHYYVWLVAIPRASRSTSPSSRPRISKTLGLVMLCCALFGLCGWMFLGFSLARDIYFCFAAYHSFLEICGLCALYSHRLCKYDVLRL